MDIKEARETMWQAFAADNEFAGVYIATIACLLTDAQSSAGEKLDFNDYATRMSVAKNIFTRLYSTEGTSL